MPIKIRKVRNKNKWKVTDGNEVYGVHNSKSSARQQQKAIYAQKKRK